MSEKFQVPTWSAKNPLGIIALFISLIYAMSALLLGASIDRLAHHNQTVLVLFIIIFPFIVLGVFAWLVAHHHKKLYGPGDFRSDEGFQSIQDAPSESLGERLRKEVTQQSVEEEPEKRGEVSASASAPSAGKKDVGNVLQSSVGELSRINKAYIAEGLVFQDLQNRYGGSYRRNIYVKTNRGGEFAVDGILQGPNGHIVVEVKFFGKTSEYARRIRETLRYIETMKEIFIENKISADKFVLAIVMDKEIDSADIEIIRGRIQNINSGSTEIIIYSFEELAAKFGLR